MKIKNVAIKQFQMVFEMNLKAVGVKCESFWEFARMLSSPDAIVVNKSSANPLLKVINKNSSKRGKPASSWKDAETYILTEHMSVIVYRSKIDLTFEFKPSLSDVVESYQDIKEEIFKIKMEE